MSNTTNTSLTLVDAYENCLDRPLKRKDLSRYPLTHKELSILARAVGEHYKTYHLPPKADSELRPSISPGTNNSVGLDYVFSKNHFRGTFEYKFDRSTEGEMTANLKRYLLYCHSLVFQDPLPYLLDYFEDGIGDDTALRRLPAVNTLLCEYADLNELIKKGILIPVSQPAIYLSDLPVLDEATLATLEERLPQFSQTKIRALAREVLEEQYRRRRFNDNVDLCFPDTDNVPVLRELLKLTEKKFSSADILEPFGLSILGSVSSINPHAITTDDLVRIRNHDELFEEWRSFVSHVFREIQSREQNYTSVDAEFALAVQEEFLSWRISSTLS